MDSHLHSLISRDRLYISRSRISRAGRGVFTRSAIAQGTCIERCPVIEISKNDAQRVNESSLVEYIYYVGKQKDTLFLVLGFGSLYNHSDTPSAVYKALLNKHVLEFIATRDIKKDEEITVNYGQGSQKDTSPLWFMGG